MAIFGYAGTDTDDYFGPNNLIIGGYFQMGATGGTGDSITTYFYSSGDEHVKCALYKADKSLVANGVTEERIIPAQAVTWTTFNFVGTKPTLVANAWYYIQIWAGAVASVRQYVKTSAGYGAYTQSKVYDGFPDPANPVAYNASWKVDIYCTYTEAGGAAGTLSLFMGMGTGIQTKTKGGSLPKVGPGHKPSKIGF